MDCKHFTKIAFALATLPLQGSVISYISTASDTSPANGNAVTFSGMLGIQQFDPSLGTLNSVSFSLYHTGFLWQDVTSNGGYKDYIVSGSLSFLGVTEPIWTDEMYYPCADCPYRTNVSYYNGVHMDAMRGTVTDGLDTFQRWASGQGYMTFATHQGDLNMFIGTGSILLPVESNLVARFVGASSTLLSEQTIGWQGSYAYNYTPSVQISEIAITPEPNYGVILAVGLVCLFIGKIWTRKQSPPTEKCGWCRQSLESTDVQGHFVNCPKRPISV